MSSFFEGFEKQALLSRRVEDVAAGVASLIPGGTLAHTAFADRPEGHSRIKEFIYRKVPSYGTGHAFGALAAKAGKNLKAKNNIVRGAKAIGKVVGEVIGSRVATDKYYQG